MPGLMTYSSHSQIVDQGAITGRHGQSMWRGFVLYVLATRVLPWGAAFVSRHSFLFLVLATGLALIFIIGWIRKAEWWQLFAG